MLTVFRTSSSDKLTGLPRLRFTVNKQHLFPTLQNIWEGLHSESSLAVNQDAGLLHTETTADPHHENEGYGKSLDNILWKHVDKNISLATGSQARKVSPGKLLQKHGDKPAVEVPGSSVLHGTRKGLIVSTHKRLMNTPTPSSVSETHINSVLTKATCNPKFHIVFLKTHKTASSTILNILYRYGESRKLTFALPLNKHSQLFYPFPFTSNFVEGVSSRSVKEFHIMCNHMRFRKFEVSFITKLWLNFQPSLHMDCTWSTTRYVSKKKNPGEITWSHFAFDPSQYIHVDPRLVNDRLTFGPRLGNVSKVQKCVHRLTVVPDGLGHVSWQWGWGRVRGAQSPRGTFLCRHRQCWGVVKCMRKNHHVHT